MVETKFENLKIEIINLINSDELTTKAILFKFFPPEELLMNGFLFQCIYEMNDKDNPFTNNDIECFIAEYKCDLVVLENTAGYTYKDLEKRISVLSVMRYLEIELYNFLRSLRLNPKSHNKMKIWDLIDDFYISPHVYIDPDPDVPPF